MSSAEKIVLTQSKTDCCFSSLESVTAITTHSPSEFGGRKKQFLALRTCCAGLFFVMASAGLLCPSIHFTSEISCRSHDWQRHIRSIINRFSCVVPNFTKHSYKLLEAVQTTRDKVRNFLAVDSLNFFFFFFFLA